MRVSGLDSEGDNWLALRSTTGKDAVRLRKLTAGTPLTFDGERSGAWIKVRTSDGVEGWVLEKYTTN